MPAEVDLVVHLFGGGDYRFRVNVNTTSVRDLKVLVSPEANLPVDDHILVYNGETLSDTLTLKEAGIYGSNYKVILGSKSFSPMGRPEDAPPLTLINTYCCSLHSRMERDFKDNFTYEEIRKLCTTMWHKMNDITSKNSYEHLENVAAAAMEVHDAAMRNHRENYFKTFLDCRWEHVESSKIMKARRAAKKVAYLAAEASGEPS